jgi:adenosylmethionine-8-amino-7-oxononanoate aminotransferase
LSPLEELAVVGEVRGAGMMLGIELVSDKRTRQPLSMHSAPHDVIRRETGVLVRDCAHTLVMSPPLVMTEDEADEAVAGVRSVLERMSPDGSVAPL